MQNFIKYFERLDISAPFYEKIKTLRLLTMKTMILAVGHALSACKSAQGLLFPAIFEKLFSKLVLSTPNLDAVVIPVFSFHVPLRL